MEQLTDFLKQERINRDFDVRKLAMKSGITNSQISRIETGKSDLTVEALVKLAYGLNIPVEKALAVLPAQSDKPEDGSPITSDDAVTYLARLEYLRNRNSVASPYEPIPSERDIYSAVLCFKDQPKKVEDILIGGFLENQEKPNHPLLDKAAVVDHIDKAIHAQSGHFSPLPYPETNDLDKIYAAGGVITLPDLGVFIKLTRKQSGRSLRDIADYRISHSTIARFEQGYVDRILFSQILDLDYRICENKGALIAYAWEAEEYETGIVINRELNTMKQEWSLLEGWNPVEKAVADTLVTICRWHHVQEGDQSWWIKTKHILDSYTA